MNNHAIRTETFRGRSAGLAFVVLLTALLIAAPIPIALAQVAPSLGTAQNFAVLGGSTVTNTGSTIVTGDLGVDPGTAITGFPPGTIVGGTTHAADAVAIQAQSDSLNAYNNLASQACSTTVSTDLGGLTLMPGVYCFSSSAQLTGQLTLDAEGDSSAVWVFQTGSTLITATGSEVLLTGGAQNCNVFWEIGSSATIGTGSTFVGNILALTSITLDTNAAVFGSALARNGAVTLDANTVAVSACGAVTLSKAFNPSTIDAGDGSTLTITLSNADSTAANLTGALTDTLPGGVVVSGSASTTCAGGTTSIGTSTVTLAGGSIPANGSCDLTVGVLAASGGNYINSLAAGALQTNNGDNAGPAMATLTVAPPSGVTLGKAFSPATIIAGGGSIVTITLINPNSTAANLTAPLTDSLPSGLVISGNASTTCGGTPTAGTKTVTLTGGTIPANGYCTLTVGVIAAGAGSYHNSLAAGALKTSNGNNASAAVSTLTVNTPASIPPTLSKSFSPATITAGGVSTLTITLTNPNSTVANLTAPLTDNLPHGVVVASPGGTNCGGTYSGQKAGTSVTVSGGSIPANGSRTVTVS
ncbi:MAG: ice-binding family protein, partial [Bryobacteraceae bacterium]